MYNLIVEKTSSSLYFFTTLCCVKKKILILFVVMMVINKLYAQINNQAGLPTLYWSSLHLHNIPWFLDAS